MFYCKHCERETASKCGNTYHENRCLKNPEIIKNKKIKINFCENCGKEHDCSYGSGRFCSKACARSSATSKDNFKQTKVCFCSNCNKEVLINKRRRTDNFLCENCINIKDQERKSSLIKPCPFCGRKIKMGSGYNHHVNACKYNPNSKKTKLGYKRKDIRTGYIYMITCKITNKRYVGKRKGHPEDSESYYGSGLAIKKAIALYGKENFQKEVLEIIIDGDLNERERFWIMEKDTFGENGYNLTFGGDGGPLFSGRKHSESSIKKILESRKGL